METKTAYEKKLQAQIDEWRAEIDKLKAIADQAEAETQIEYNQQIDKLSSYENMANRKLAEIREAGDDAWKDLKSGAENAMKSLESALKSAASRFRND